jgi:hypothetical protein
MKYDIWLSFVSAFHIGTAKSSYQFCYVCPLAEYLWISTKIYQPNLLLVKIFQKQQTLYMKTYVNS